MIIKKWRVCELDKDEVSSISQECDIDTFLSMLLYVKGIREKSDIFEYLSDELILSDPFKMKDMDKAVERIRSAIENHEKICVFGDYDADGITATVLVYDYLTSQGAQVEYYIPNRIDEGYGLNDSSIESLSDANVKLIITVDNGIVAFDQIKMANQLGIDVVVTDHHKQQENRLPEAVAVVDPHRHDCESNLKMLAGVGVAFKLVTALEYGRSSSIDIFNEYSDILMVGTVADIVPLVGENRSIVKNALNRAKSINRIGLLTLIDTIGLRCNTLASVDIGFKLAPRINATGRLNCSEKAVDLFLSEDYSLARELADFVENTNQKRKEIESTIFKEIERTVLSDPKTFDKRIIIVSGENYHMGVIGIVASKISNSYGKPTIVISKDPSTGIATASGRSVEGFSLYDAVFYARSLLTKFGGHTMAVGFSLKIENIDAFIKKVMGWTKRHADRMPTPELMIDCKINPASLNMDMVHQIHKLEPFGTANARPVIGLFNLTLKDVFFVAGKHLKLTLEKNGVYVRAMLFWHTPDEFFFKKGDIIDVAVELGTSVFKGKENLSIAVKEIKFSELDYQKIFDERYFYFKLVYEKTVMCSNLAEHLPNRKDFAVIYRFFRSNNDKLIRVDAILYRLKYNDISYLKLYIVLDTFKQLKLLDYSRCGDTIKVKVFSSKHKVHLENSSFLNELKSLLSPN